MQGSHPGSLALLGVLVIVFASTTTLRVWGVTKWFWLLGDQIRDWEIALGPFTALPLVGPATHVGGYMSDRFGNAAMGAVVDSVARILSGRDGPAWWHSRTRPMAGSPDR